MRSLKRSEEFPPALGWTGFPVPRRCKGRRKASAAVVSWQVEGGAEESSHLRAWWRFGTDAFTKKRRGR